MSDTTQTDTSQPQADAVWTPEPRSWQWKDIFNAPLLGFKWKCMGISFITLAVIYIVCEGFAEIQTKNQIIATILNWLHYYAIATVFGLGATLVATFMKADLLDDEFLSLKEALGQFKKRIAPAVLVPIFLISLAALFCAILWGISLAGGIPFIGPFVYSILYPFVFLAGLLTTLIVCGVVLSFFIFPGIIASRKYGWFDNVIDTFESVGTKPIVLATNSAITLGFICFAYLVAGTAMNHLKYSSATETITAIEEKATINAPYLPQWSFVSGATPSIRAQLLKFADSRATAKEQNSDTNEDADNDGFITSTTGWITGAWQTVITALLAGYLLNTFIAGGLLTYLYTREDDYWDDEDLEELDKLARELEEEALREQADVISTSPTPTATSDEDSSTPSIENTESTTADNETEVDAEAIDTETDTRDEDPSSVEAAVESDSTSESDTETKDEDNETAPEPAPEEDKPDA